MAYKLSTPHRPAVHGEHRTWSPSFTTAGVQRPSCSHGRSTSPAPPQQLSGDVDLIRQCIRAFSEQSIASRCHRCDAGITVRYATRPIVNLTKLIRDATGPEAVSAADLSVPRN